MESLSLKGIKEVMLEGDVIGETIPNTEFGGQWTEVYLYDKRLYAIVQPQCTVGQQISIHEMPAYVEDPILTRKLYTSLLTPHVRAK